MKSTNVNDVIAGSGMDIKAGETCMCDCVPCPPKAPTSQSSLQSHAVNALGKANIGIMPPITIGDTK